MQPLARFSQKLAFKPNPSLASRSLQTYSRPSVRASICVQCRLQLRRHSENSKPNKSSTSLDPDPSSNSSEDGIKNLPSAAEGRRAAITKRFSYLMDNLQGNIFIASQRINDLTGYSGIESLKSCITTLEERVQESQEAVRASRLAYKTTVADRAATQREVTTLLARKDTWTPIDLERFTSLYRMDHTNEQAVQEAATRLADTEREAEHAASKLSSSILSRYHEEQIWSDKIRRMSTWGTWGLMGVNVLLFLVFQFGFEPWRRARLVNGFEEKVLKALEKQKLAQSARNQETIAPLLGDGAATTGLRQATVGVESQEQILESIVDPSTDLVPSIGEDDRVVSDTIETPFRLNLSNIGRPESWLIAFKDLFSNRMISMRKQDLTLAALEGAATGAAVVTIIATVLVRHS